MVQRGSHLHDFVVLLMEFEIAAHAAVSADRRRLGLAAFVPRPGLTAVIFTLEHQRAGWANRNTVTAIHARRFWEGIGELRGNASIEPTSRHRDRKCVLPIRTAPLN